jgi:hypothetical protein
MNGTLYKALVFRYVYDTVSGEFVNIGVAVCAPEAKYFTVKFNLDCSRISRFFRPIDGNFYRLAIHSIAGQVQQLQQRWQKGAWLWEKQTDIDWLMAQVIPLDDSSFVYASIGGGLSEDLDSELTHLYHRYVIRYVNLSEGEISPGVLESMAV